MARGALVQGQEILVSHNPAPALEDADWPFEVSFDGGAGSREGGAGAAL